jgi:hypothetical protein
MNAAQTDKLMQADDPTLRRQLIPDQKGSGNSYL